MLGSRIEELLASEIDANANAATAAGSAANVGGFSIIADESRQRQLLLEDEEEDFMDEGTSSTITKAPLSLIRHQLQGAKKGPHLPINAIKLPKFRLNGTLFCEKSNGHCIFKYINQRTVH